MIDPGAQALVLLETFPDLISGRVAAAHLESEGIPARLEGEPLGPYPLGQREDPATFADVGSADQERPPRPTAPIFWVSLVIVALLLARALYWLF
jgi:pimeloyl-ACP methyl ester carboxylesterase